MKITSITFPTVPLEKISRKILACASAQFGVLQNNHAFLPVTKGFIARSEAILSIGILRLKIYSIVETAKDNGCNPYFYLRYLLEMILSPVFFRGFFIFQGTASLYAYPVIEAVQAVIELHGTTCIINSDQGSQAVAIALYYSQSGSGRAGWQLSLRDIWQTFCGITTLDMNAEFLKFVS